MKLLIADTVKTKLLAIPFTDIRVWGLAIGHWQIGVIRFIDRTQADR